MKTVFLTLLAVCSLTCFVAGQDDARIQAELDASYDRVVEKYPAMANPESQMARRASAIYEEWVNTDDQRLNQANYPEIITGIVAAEFQRLAQAERDRSRSRNEFRPWELRNPASREIFKDEIQAHEDRINPPSREELEMRRLRSQMEAQARAHAEAQEQTQAQMQAQAAAQAQAPVGTILEFSGSGNVYKVVNLDHIPIGTMSYIDVGRAIYTDASGRRHRGRIQRSGLQRVFFPDLGPDEEIYFNVR